MSLSSSCRTFAAAAPISFAGARRRCPTRKPGVILCGDRRICIDAQWGERQITEITRAEVRACVDAMMLRGAPAMAGRALKVIRAFFNWCVGRGLIEASPCVGLMPPPATRPRDRVLSDDELVTVLRTARTLPHPFGSIVAMLAERGRGVALGRA
ncbi:phage integrase central domain-containing protein [Aestuariivirga sp.]|uniref:phage integrase central domain-containing protein n=1 Tax=Aestuariivirga sp. TaxID=2650926 RepID=UPI00391C7701